MEQPRSLTELRSGAIDLVVGLEYNFTPTLDIPGLDTELLLSEPVYVALPVTHPLASTGATLDDLAEELWIVPSAPNPCRHAVLRAAELAGFEPRLRSLESSNYIVITAAIALGLGVTVLPHLALQACGPNVVTYPLDIPLRRGSSSRCGQAGASTRRSQRWLRPSDVLPKASPRISPPGLARSRRRLTPPS